MKCDAAFIKISQSLKSRMSVKSKENPLVYLMEKS